MENYIAHDALVDAFIPTKYSCASEVHTAIRPYLPKGKSRMIPSNAEDQMEPIFKASTESASSRVEYNKEIGALIQEEFGISNLMPGNIAFEVPDSQIDSIPFASFLNEK